MGNNCCADNSQFRHFDPSMRKMHDMNPSTSQINLIKFPDTRTPRKHPIVAEIQSHQGIFKAKNTIQITSGVMAEPKLLNSQGLVYKGEWSNGIPHGKGELFYPDGSYYIGYFSKGVADGEGRFVSPNGWIYEGELENEQAQGKGTLYHKDLKYRYEGYWSGDLPNGQGQQIWQNKRISYEGEYLNGKKHGKGKYRTPDFEYDGNFNNNQFHSYGFIQYQKGGKYQGNFQNGKKHGKGIYTWPDNSYYEGHYRYDQKHGQGRYKSPDSVYWQGQWVNGRREGIGTLIFGDRKMLGIWKNDRPTDKTSSQIRSRIMNDDSRLRV